jgi:integrase
MVQRLTDKVVRLLERPATGNKITYDSQIRGFGARITAAGAISFVLNYRRKSDGLERRATIGSFPAWSAAGARERAAELRRHVDSGGDPIGELAAERGAPTVSDLCARFIEEHVMTKQRRSTRVDYIGIINNDVLPALGKFKVAAVDFDNIERLHHKVTLRAPVRANRMLAVVSKMFALSIRWKMRKDNPCKGVARNQEHHRRRYLSSEELARLTAALAKHPQQEVADCVRLLLLTGARRGEALNATWNQFDLATGVWSKPPSHTKQARHHQVPLSAPARELLVRLHEQAAESPFVFPSRLTGRKARTNLDHGWRLICRAAGITGLRIHDLRHSFASNLVGAGFSLPVIGALLGHSNPATTSRYAHLAHDPLREAAERVGAIVSGKPSAEIKPLHGRRR